MFGISSNPLPSSHHVHHSDAQREPEYDVNHFIDQIDKVLIKLDSPVERTGAFNESRSGFHRASVSGDLRQLHEDIKNKKIPDEKTGQVFAKLHSFVKAISHRQTQLGQDRCLSLCIQGIQMMLEVATNNLGSMNFDCAIDFAKALNICKSFCDESCISQDDLVILRKALGSLPSIVNHLTHMVPPRTKVHRLRDSECGQISEFCKEMANYIQHRVGFENKKIAAELNQLGAQGSARINERIAEMDKLIAEMTENDLKTAVGLVGRLLYLTEIPKTPAGNTLRDSLLLFNEKVHIYYKGLPKATLTVVENSVNNRKDRLAVFQVFDGLFRHAPLYPLDDHLKPQSSTASKFKNLFQWGNSGWNQLP